MTNQDLRRSRDDGPERQTPEPNQRSIPRADLIAIVAAASEGVTLSTREALLKVAATTDAVAVNWFSCDGIGCPARQARRRHQRFQEAFDREMCDRFGVPFDVDPPEPFVVEVTS